MLAGLGQPAGGIGRSEPSRGVQELDGRLQERRGCRCLERRRAIDARREVLRPAARERRRRGTLERGHALELERRLGVAWTDLDLEGLRVERDVAGLGDQRVPERQARAGGFPERDSHSPDEFERRVAGAADEGLAQREQLVVEGDRPASRTLRRNPVLPLLRDVGLEYLGDAREVRERQAGVAGLRGAQHLGAQCRLSLDRMRQLDPWLERGRWFGRRYGAQARQAEPKVLAIVQLVEGKSRQLTDVDAEGKKRFGRDRHRCGLLERLDLLEVGQ